jgi:hypothetical protein
MARAERLTRAAQALTLKAPPVTSVSPASANGVLAALGRAFVTLVYYQGDEGVLLASLLVVRSPARLFVAFAR